MPKGKAAAAAATDPRLISMGTDADSTDAEDDDSGNNSAAAAESSPSSGSSDDSAAAAASTAARARAGLADGLTTFQLHPKDKEGKNIFIGEAHLGHLVAYRNQRVGANPNPALDLAIGHRQMECIAPTGTELTRSRIIADAGGEGAILKISARKLDTLGYIQGHCGHMTNPERMKRVRDHLALSSSVAAIQRAEQERAGKKREEDNQKLDDTAPAAARALFSVYNVGDDLEAVCNKNKRKVTKAHLAALLRKVYQVTIQSNKGKPEHVKCLAKEISNDDGAKLQSYYDSLPVPAAGGDGDHDDQIRSEEEGGDDGPDYGEEYYDKRVAKYHVEDTAEDGGPRLCFGTVIESGFPEDGPRKKFMHWKVEFDEDDAAVYNNGERGEVEDLDYNELMDAFELYEEWKEDDNEKPSAN